MRSCARCQAPILVESDAMRINSDVYCCSNCAVAATAAAPAADEPTCSHCGVSIVNSLTQMTREKYTFCCANCAAAMAQKLSGGIRVRQHVAGPRSRNRINHR